jgi:hypothetical protein
MKADFLRVGVRGRRAKSLTGLDGTPDRCALLCGLMAKVELRNCLENPLAAYRWHTLLTMENRKYPTDLSDDEWDCVRPHLYGLKGTAAPGRCPRDFFASLVAVGTINPAIDRSGIPEPGSVLGEKGTGPAYDY